MLTINDFKEKQWLFVFCQNKEHWRFINNNLVIEEENHKIKYQISAHKLLGVMLVGYCSITGAVFQKAQKFGFSIVFMSPFLHVYTRISSKIEGNVILRKKQYQYQDLSLAQWLVKNKIFNQLYLLKAIRKKSDWHKKTIQKIKGYLAKLEDKSLSNNQILAIEGLVSKNYFKIIFADIPWKRRMPRVKEDPINCLLDLGYTLAFNFVESLLNLYGFDIYVGVYHQFFYQRKSLVCDLMEPLRPVIDRAIKNAFHYQQVKQEDFLKINGQYRLVGNKAKPYVQLLLKALMKYKQAYFRYVQDYYRAFMNEKPLEQFPFFRLNDYDIDD